MLSKYITKTELQFFECISASEMKSESEMGYLSSTGR